MIPFREQLKNLWFDVKAMRSGYPANQYELGRYSDIYKRHAFAVGNHYDASNAGRLQDDWTTSANTPTNNYKRVWKTIIARAIKSFDNNPHTVALLNTLISNVVGTGLRPQPRVKHKNGEPYKELNKQLDDGWKRYNDQWDATGRMTHLEAQKMRFGEIFRTGTTLTNKVKAPKENFLSVQNQVVHVLRLDDSKDLLSPSFNDPNIKNTVFGINLNEYGKPVSYWINGQNTPVSADNMRHSYRQTMAEQYIGIPWITAALKYLWANENLIKDKLIASRIQSMIGLFVPDSMYNRMVSKDLNTDNEISMESGKIYHGKNATDLPQVIQADDSIKDVLEPLQRLLLHAIAMTLGISYQSITRDLVKTNMASGKINTNEDRKTYRHIQKWFLKELQPDWDEFVFRMFLENKIKGASIVDYLKDPWKFNQCQWQPTGFEYIDPAREAAADIDLKDNGMLPLKRFFGEHGQDWQDSVDQILIEKQYIQNKMKEMGIEEEEKSPEASEKRKKAVNDRDREE